MGLLHFQSVQKQFLFRYCVRRYVCLYSSIRLSAVCCAVVSGLIWLLIITKKYSLYRKDPNPSTGVSDSAQLLHEKAEKSFTKGDTLSPIYVLVISDSHFPSNSPTAPRNLREKWKIGISSAKIHLLRKKNI